MEIMEISPYECCVCGYTKTLMSHYSFSLHSIPAKTEELAYAWESATGINKILFLQGAKVIYT